MANLTVPIIFSELPAGTFPMSYFDQNFAFILENLQLLVQLALANLPTVIPQTPNTLWNNQGAISITPPAPYPNPGFTPWR